MPRFLNIMRFLYSILFIAPHFLKGLYITVIFFILLILFLIEKCYSVLEHIPLIGRIFRSFHMVWSAKFGGVYRGVIVLLERQSAAEVRRSYIIHLAYRNLMTKKTRSLITIFGMSVGVGVIVLLLSLGYGIENLVVSRVASLDELKIVDVAVGDNTSVQLKKEVVNDISKIKGVQKIAPVISLVGRLDYKKAGMDVVVYAAPKDYLQLNRTKIIQGSMYDDNGTLAEGIGSVAGAETSLTYARYGQRVNDYTLIFNVIPNQETPVWEDCRLDAKLLGHTSRVEGGYQGVLIYGSEYYDTAGRGRAAYEKDKKVYLGRWIQAQVPLYASNENNTYRPVFDDSGRQQWVTGCIPQKYLKVSEGYALHHDVLGVSTEQTASDSGAQAVAAEATDTEKNDINGQVLEASTEAGLIAERDSLQSTDSAKVEMVSLDTKTLNPPVKDSYVSFKQEPSRVMLASSGLLNTLGVQYSNSHKPQLGLSMVVTKSIAPDLGSSGKTKQESYQVIGVIDDPDNQYIYVPLSDIKKLGARNVSQLKVQIADQTMMADIRKRIETMGFRTTSTLDTVQQIESLFGNLRLMLGVLGLVALGVACLGMFNTLTVSLLERTREIGGMKTMGMVSIEVQDLFLAEAIIMSVAGGAGGLLFGYIVGKSLSFIVSIFAIAGGQGYLELTYIPPFLLILILIASFIVGLLTGIFPARRAKKISALNALRYE